MASTLGAAGWTRRVVAVPATAPGTAQEVTEQLMNQIIGRSVADPNHPKESKLFAGSESNS
jgi:hypothetical protein